ncbi:unnamed protein product, partial [Rotaria sp. Silwood1]
LKVHDSDGNVIQFQYDEYSLAVEKCTYLKEAYYQFLVANQLTILHQDEYSHIIDTCSSTKKKINNKNFKKNSCMKKKKLETASNLGVITENFDDLIRNYITTNEKLDQTKMDKRAFEKNDVF